MSLANIITVKLQLEISFKVLVESITSSWNFVTIVKKIKMILKILLMIPIGQMAFGQELREFFEWNNVLSIINFGFNFKQVVFKAAKEEILVSTAVWVRFYFIFFILSYFLKIVYYKLVKVFLLFKSQINQILLFLPDLSVPAANGALNFLEKGEILIGWIFKYHRVACSFNTFYSTRI